MRYSLFVVLFLLAGCQATSPVVLGLAPTEAMEASVRTVLTEKPKQTLQLQGTLVEKCPTSGCWFRLKDKTGTVLVDLKPAGLTAAEIPVGMDVRAVGTVETAGDEIHLRATGIRY